jgi:hypothetical protein
MDTSSLSSRFCFFMSQRKLSQRLSSIESQLAILQDELRSVADGQAKSWQRAIERYAGDEDLLHVFRDAAKLREAERTKARKRRTAPRRTTQ